MPHAPEGTPVVEFRAAGNPDPRDILDGAVDVLVTREAGVVRYAAGRGDWRVVPLPWDRVYVLASPVRIRSGTGTQLDSAVQAALARDAVRDDARAPEPGRPWWAMPCDSEALEPAGGIARPAPARSSTLIASADDQVASDLVARLVARADDELADLLGEQGDAVRGAILTWTDYAARLAAGDAVGFVVPLPARPLDRCRAAADLRAAAPWLVVAGTAAADVLAPLVETRGHLLLRDAPGIALDHDAGVRLVPNRRP